MEIKLGSKGGIVKQWQKFLGVTVDGTFGARTAEATRFWQARNGLRADGIVGAQTLKIAQNLGFVLPITTATENKLLTQVDFERAAARLKCEIACVKAVAEIESKGDGFYPNGFPTILFERHVFRKYTEGKYNRSHPHLSGPAGNYGAEGQHQINKFYEAYALNPKAAVMACSWGKFQVMGFNYAVCEYDSVADFFEAMKESEGKHLEAFIGYVIGNNLADELRNKKWAAFARGYNGEGYAKNKYDVKLAAAYKKYAGK